ncbi:hypothetical protein [Phenylobacterium sp.]|uniref:hypothetical protein n=1 Tax=Phenylobacterium sp. TaxID=1871053 RepID=UPI00391923CE
MLDGGGGDDLIWGDRGSDTISGGAGADLLGLHTWSGVDRVTDFNRAEGDQVRVEAGATYTVSQVGADVVINVTGGAQMVLVGVQLSNLDTGWIVSV